MLIDILHHIICIFGVLKCLRCSQSSFFLTAIQSQVLCLQSHGNYSLHIRQILMSGSITVLISDQKEEKKERRSSITAGSALDKSNGWKF